MSQHENQLPDSPFSSWTRRDIPLDDAEIAELAAAHAPAIGPCVEAFARSQPAFKESKASLKKS